MRRLRYITIPLMAAALAAFSLPAVAQRPTCGPHAKVEAWLLKQFGETRKMRGVEHRGLLFEWFTSPKNTWSLVITRPGGRSCLVAAGRLVPDKKS